MFENNIVSWKYIFSLKNFEVALTCLSPYTNASQAQFATCLSVTTKSCLAGTRMQGTSAIV